MFLSDYDEKLQKLNTKSTLAAWNYYTNLTDENEKIKELKQDKIEIIDQLRKSIDELDKQSDEFLNKE